MNLDTLVKRGRRPWAPSPETRDLEVWHEYDVPTVGLFMLRSEPVVFTVLGSPDDQMTVWAYTCLTEVDAKDLSARKFSSVGELGEIVDSRFIGRQAAFVIADDLQIWRWTWMDVKESVMESASEFLSQVRESLESEKAPDAEFEVKLAGVAAAKTELISA
jgi:hypothetical protein